MVSMTAQAAHDLDWWHRDHPVFAALTGFFSGLAFVIVVPAAYVGLLRWLLPHERAEALFPYVLVALAVPLALAMPERSRRYGLYFLLGMGTTAAAVLGVGGSVLWLMLQ